VAILICSEYLKIKIEAKYKNFNTKIFKKIISIIFYNNTELIIILMNNFNNYYFF
jgi:hypothetical protein